MTCHVIIKHYYERADMGSWTTPLRSLPGFSPEHSSLSEVGPCPPSPPPENKDTTVTQIDSKTFGTSLLHHLRCLGHGSADRWTVGHGCRAVPRAFLKPMAKQKGCDVEYVPAQLIVMSCLRMLHPGMSLSQLDRLRALCPKL